MRVMQLDAPGDMQRPHARLFAIGESSDFLPARAFVRMGVRSRRQQGEQDDCDEVAERGLRPADLGSTMEPGRVDEKDDGRDQDLPEPADNEEQSRENDAPEAQLRQAYCRSKVQHVPGNPENERAHKDCCNERRECNGKPAGDQGADPENAQHDTQDWAHTSSL